MGVCVTMRRNAERTAFSGGNWVYASNWDADKIVGCDCDREAGGYDCSMQLCPRGDDPLTTGQAHEVQLLNCTMAVPSATSYFSVTMDGEATTQIPTNGEASTLRDALAAVVGTVSVTRAPVGATTTLCSPAGELHLVTFVQRHGDVPAFRRVQVLQGVRLVQRLWRRGHPRRLRVRVESHHQLPRNASGVLWARHLLGPPVVQVHLRQGVDGRGLRPAHLPHWAGVV